MMRKEIEDSKHKLENISDRFTTSKTVTVNTEETSFLDGTNSMKEASGSRSLELHYKERGDLTEDTNTSYAMCKENPGGVRAYYVKFATAGAGVGRMLNPWGVYYSPGDDVKYEKQMGRKRYEFRKVSQDVFDSYLRFLKSRNERHILSAEREMNNQ